MINRVKICKTNKKFILIHQKQVICRVDQLSKAHEMRLFFVGIKPVVRISFEEHDLPQILMLQFPYIIKKSMEEPKNGEPIYVGLILFQNENLKNVYLQAYKKPCTDNSHLAIFGELLGYPPIATQDFLERREELFGKPETFNWKTIYYHGIEFICKEEHITECLNWLDKRYYIPTEYKTKVRIWDAFKPRVRTA